MRFIKIDPFACTVEAVNVDYDPGRSSLHVIYRELSHPSMAVTSFDVVRLDAGDAIFVDAEGGCKPCARFFVLSGYHSPLAGIGLVMGSDAHGETRDAKISLGMVRHLVSFRAADVGDRKRLIGPTMTPWMEGDPAFALFD